MEANPELISDLEKVRQKDLVVSGAAKISEDDEIILHRSTKNEVSSTNKQFLEKMHDNKGGEDAGWALVDSIVVPALDVNKLIEQHLFDGRFFLLSVDTEGSDLSVIKHIDIDRFKPEFIIMEPSDEIIGRDNGSLPLKGYLATKGYDCIARTRVNLIFRRSVDQVRPRQQTLIQDTFPAAVNQNQIRNFEIDPDCEVYKNIRQEILSPKTRVVSFDVFDTALLRPVLEPKDVFRLLNRQIKEVTGLINFDFASVRILAERQLRLKIKENKEKIDPTLDQIYDRVGQLTVLPKKKIEIIKKIEVETELNFVRASSMMYHLYKLAIDAGKQIAFCSDTYFSSSTIREMLSRTGYVDYNFLIVSCEAGFTKKDGELFAELVKEANVQPEAIVHIGDNKKSDIVNCERYNIRCCYTPSPRDKLKSSATNHKRVWGDFDKLSIKTRCMIALYANKYYSRSFRGDISNTLFNGSLEAFGYYALGPFLYGLIAWLKQNVDSRNNDVIFFLSRDGYLPLKAWEKLNLSKDDGPKIEYLPISRRALIPLGLRYGDPTQALFSSPASSDMTLNEFLCSRLDQKTARDIESLLIESGLEPTDKVLQKYSSLLSILAEQKKKIDELIQPAADSSRNFYKMKFDEFQCPALFDVGRKGTFQSILSSLFNRRIHGYYVVTEGAVEFNISAKDYEALFPQVMRSLFPDEPDTVIYEALLSEQKAGHVGFSNSQEPLFDPDTTPDLESASSVEKIQAAALELIGDVKSFFGDEFLDHKSNSRSINHLLSTFKRFPEDANILFPITHEDGMFNKDRRRLLSFYSSPMSSGSISNDLISEINLKHLVFYCPAMSRIRGGVERVVSLLSGYLYRRGYKVSILTSGNEMDLAPKPVYPLPNGTKLLHVNVRDVESVRAAINSLKPDVLIVLASGQVVNPFVRLAREMGIPFMLGERAEPSASRKTYWRKEWQSRYIRIYNKADLVSVQFPVFRKFFPLLMRRKVVALPNPLMPMKQGKFTKRKKVILCVARISLQQKQQDLLVESFALIANEFPDWQLHLAGERKPGDTEIIVKLINKLGLSDRVTLLGEVSNIQEHYDSASIFAFPSAFEGFPNALAEALSSGLPAIGLRSCAGTSSLIRDGVNGYLVGGERKDIAENFSRSIRNLISSESLRETMGNAATKSMSAYSLEQSLAKWMEAINKTERRGLKRVARRRWLKPIERVISAISLGFIK